MLQSGPHAGAFVPPAEVARSGGVFDAGRAVACAGAGFDIPTELVACAGAGEDTAVGTVVASVESQAVTSSKTKIGSKLISVYMQSLTTESLAHSRTLIASWFLCSVIPTLTARIMIPLRIE
ncbi:MAG: hypothetical protein ABIQ44_07905 [Chloroflexia bacterium]